MGTTTRKQVAFAGALSLVLTIALSQCFGQASEQGQLVPTVPQLVDRVDEFFATWRSAEMSVQSDRMFVVSDTAEWKPNGYAIETLMWTESQSRNWTQEIFRPVSNPDALLATYSEVLVSGDNVFVVNGSCRDPTMAEFEGRDLELFNEGVGTIELLFYSGEEGVKERHTVDPRLPLLTGHIYSDADDEATILEPFRLGGSGKVMSSRMLDRPCWTISTVGSTGNGTLSITVCPELGYAPLEMRRTLNRRDRHWNGTLLSEIVDKAGRAMISIEQLVVFESIDPDWKEFVIRSLTHSQYEGGGHDGRGSVSRYANVVRPASSKSVNLQSVIADGAPVIMMYQEQLKAEWRDGKVVRVYDGEVIKELATVHMVPAGPNWVRWSILALLTIAGGVWLWKWRSRNALLKMKPNIRRR